MPWGIAENHEAELDALARRLRAGFETGMLQLRTQLEMALANADIIQARFDNTNAQLDLLHGRIRAEIELLKPMCEQDDRVSPHALTEWLESLL